MEAETVTVTLDEKRQENPGERNREQRTPSAGKDGAKGGGGDATPRGKEAKAGPERPGPERPAPERKR